MRRLWQRGPDGEIVRSQPAAEPPEGAAADAATEALPTPARASLLLALRLGFRDVWDHLGGVLFLSVVWGVLVSFGVLGGRSLGGLLFGALPGLLPLLLGVACAVGGAVLVGGPLTAGVYRYARNAAARQEPELLDLFWGFRRMLGRSLGLAAILSGVGLLLAVDCYVFMFQHSAALVMVGAIFGYTLLFWNAMSLYAWALLAEQELSAVAVLKKSALLVLDNFRFTLGLGLLVLLLSAVLWLSVLGGALLWGGGVPILLTQATRELLRRYRVLPPDPTLDPIAGETHELRGLGWHE